MMKVKVTLISAEEPEIRRMTLENDPDFAEFERKVSELFGETTGTFTFHWKDDESDTITMSSDEEFREAMKSANEETLRIFLQRIKDHSKMEEEMDLDYKPCYKKDKLTDEEFRPRRWERRRRHRRGFGQDQSPTSFCRFRQIQQQMMDDQSLSEKRMRRYMRRNIGNRERFDKPGSSIHQFRAGCGKHRAGCGRQRKKILRCQEGDKNVVSSDTCSGKPGTWNRSWRCNRRPVQHFRQRLDGAYMAHDRCRSRKRNGENLREFRQGRKCCRRSNSAPPTRLYGRNLGEFGMMMHGKGKRCRRSTSVPECRRKKDGEMLVGKRCRRRGYRNGKLILKFNVNSLPTCNHICESFTDSAYRNKKSCLGRRCKSYRRRAAMLANEESKNSDDSITQQRRMEPEISELVETMTIEDDKDGIEEPDAGTAVGKSNERKRKCRRHCQRRDKDDETAENNASKETNKRKYHCKRRCGHKRHFVESPDAIEKQETAEDEHPTEGKRQRKCRVKVWHHAMEINDDTGCKKRRVEEHGFGTLTLKVKMNDNMKMRPRKLARKLCKMFKQYGFDCQENRPRGRRYGQEEFLGRPLGFDFERQYRRMPCRQGRRQERVRFLSPEFQWNSGKNFASDGPRRIRPRDCPW